MLTESIGGCVQIKVTTWPHTECSDDKTKQTNKAGFHSKCFDTSPNFDTLVSITVAEQYIFFLLPDVLKPDSKDNKHTLLPLHHKTFILHFTAI